MTLIEVNNLDSPPTATVELTKGELLFMRDAYECMFMRDAFDLLLKRTRSKVAMGPLTTAIGQLDQILVEFEYLEKST